MIEATPINGHYRVYYRGGAHCVNASYVNLKLVNVAKPSVSHTAIVDTKDLKCVNIRGAADIKSALIGVKVIDSPWRAYGEEAYYTIVSGGEARYAVDDGRAPGFTYYP